MDGNFVGFAAVVMVFAIPLAAIYAFYRVRRLRTEERLAAIARGVSVPMEPELTQAAHSRRWGILLVFGSLGYFLDVQPDWTRGTRCPCRRGLRHHSLCYRPGLLPGFGFDPARSESVNNRVEHHFSGAISRSLPDTALAAACHRLKPTSIGKELPITPEACSTHSPFTQTWVQLLVLSMVIWVFNQWCHPERRRGPLHAGVEELYLQQTARGIRVPRLRSG